ncbi:MAG: FKBP-type peptidyl-prolyl cis-trans isomerase [Lachnospiraceae bacterium]|nr:FKBP-type peptidyl-prolyl cis-trans isomerase [Lachnospiraceae bacterium]
MNKQNRALALQKKKNELKKQKIRKILNICIPCVLAVAVIVVAGILISNVGNTAYKESVDIPSRTVMAEDGTFLNIKPSDYVELPSYKGLSISEDDIKVTDDELKKEIDDLIEKYPFIDTTAGVLVKDGDKVSIDFTGYHNGEVFSGGSSNDYPLTIGSGSFVDTFEEQLIDKAVGQNVEVNVTFPETYTNNPDLAGEKVKFDVTIKGIYAETVFDDAFVAKNLPDYESAEDYKKQFSDNLRASKLEDKALTVLADLVKHTGKKYPDGLYEYYRQELKAQYEYEYEYNNQMYQMYFGRTMFDSFEAYLAESNLTVKSFEEAIDKQAKMSVDFYLTIALLAENEGITVTDEEVSDYMINNGVSDVAESISANGRGYYAQGTIVKKVLKMIADNAVIK